MVKVVENTSKYPSCIACHDTKDKKTFQIELGDDNNKMVIGLCEDCLLELRGKICIAVD